MIRKAILFGTLMVAAPALAGVEFQPYEGKDVISEGQGGTRVSKHGVDYWTMGEPPRKYQIIGLIIDERKDNRLSGKTIGSETIAKKVLAAGGSAVIVQDLSARQTGTAFIGNLATNVTKNTTRLLVVKYLD